MINLLPPKEKKELFLKKVNRVVIIWGTVILASLLCLILALFSIKIYISGKVESQKIILEQSKKEYDISDIKNLQGVIKEHNEKILNLKNFYRKSIYLTEILEKISKIPFPGIYLTSLSLNKPSESLKDSDNKEIQDNRIKVTISGFSNTRENLSLFKKNLEEEKSFKDVYFYPSSWIKPINIDFSLTLRVENES